MSEFNELFDDQFFIIDSNNLKNIKTKFYGYSIANNEILFGDSLIDENNLMGCGSYLYVNVNDKFININQDFNGSYGLYFFKDGDYFAISNSFLKLVEYLKDDFNLSINKEYGEAFLFADLCSYAYCETLVNEITLLPRNYKVVIDKEDKKIIFQEIDYGEQTVSIDSKESFDIIDSWYFRWVELFRSIKNKTNNLSIDLSGGFDSRIVACLWLTANIDLNKVNIKTLATNLYGHEIEDFKISSKIADEFKFKLNNSSFSHDYYYFEDALTILNIIFYNKFGFHKQWFYPFYKLSGPVFIVTGDGGETLRGYPNKTSEEYLKHVSNYCYPDEGLINSTISVVKRAWSKLIEKFDVNEENEELPSVHYTEVRNRHHFGKGAVQSRFSNYIPLMPLIDPELHKVNFLNNDCNDSSLLFALIYSRYCPKLLDFEFEGNREIPEKVIDYAKKLNEKYPFIPAKYDFISGPSEGTVEKLNSSKFSKKDIEDDLKRIYYSSTFKNDFIKFFSESSYRKVSRVIETQSSFSLKHVYSAMPVIFVDKLIKTKDKTINDIYKYYLNDGRNVSLIPKEIENKLLIYNTIRIDFKCYGKDCDVEIIENSDLLSEFRNFRWFKKMEGEGFIIESYAGAIDLKIKCENANKMKIWFRTTGIKDTDGNEFPIYVDYQNIIIDDETVLNENKLIWKNKPLIYQNDLNSETVSIHVEWRPFTQNSLFINQFKEKSEKLKRKNKKIKKENEDLKNKLNEVFESNSWKLTSIFRRK